MCVHNIIILSDYQFAQHIFKELGEFDIISGFTSTPLIAAHTASYWKSNPAHAWVGCSVLRTIYQPHTGSAWSEYEHLDSLVQSHTQPCVHAIEILSDCPFVASLKFSIYLQISSQACLSAKCLAIGYCISTWPIHHRIPERRKGEYIWMKPWILIHQNMFTYT